MRAMDFKETRKSYYFPSRKAADGFKSELSRRNVRVSGRVAVRSTLATRRHGTHFITDTRHEGGYTVTILPFAMPDTIEANNIARDLGAMSPPHSTR